MQFLYHELAGASRIELSGDGFTHVFSARRARARESLRLRNLRDSMLHTYTIESISKKSAYLALESSIDAPRIPRAKPHLLWAITQSKTIEKALPSLNELGLSRLSLFWSDFSQRGQRLDLERLQKIIISSCEQCGRSDMCAIEILESTQEALTRYPHARVLDFGGKEIAGELGGDMGGEHSGGSGLGLGLSKTNGGERAGRGLELDSGVLVGAEGGFSPRERELFASREILRFATPHILRSQTAALALLAKVL